jgi:predicted metal-binding membrane protein
VRIAVDGRRPFVVALTGLVFLAWLALWAWGQSPYGRFLSHETIDSAALPVFVLGWTLMVVAMMLPTSLPLIAMFERLTRRRPDHLALIALLLVGYLSAWACFGLLVNAADLVLHNLVRLVPWLSEHAWLVGAVTLVGAGAYQFSSVKYRCLEKCRSPFSFIAEHWRGAGEARQAFRLGVSHGLFCVGCCWLLMLLMFAVGVGNLGWMLLLGAIMAIEKNMTWGRQISTPLGVGLIAWGLGVTLSSLLPPRV